MKIFVGMVATFIYLKLVQHFEPYIDRELNRMKETSLWQIAFILLLALLIKADEINFSALRAFLVITFFANFIVLLCEQSVHFIRGRAGATTAAMEENELMDMPSAVQGYGCAGGDEGRVSSEVTSKDTDSVTVSPLCHEI